MEGGGPGFQIVEDQLRKDIDDLVEVYIDEFRSSYPDDDKTADLIKGLKRRSQKLIDNRSAVPPPRGDGPKLIEENDEPSDDDEGTIQECQDEMADDWNKKHPDKKKEPRDFWLTCAVKKWEKEIGDAIAEWVEEKIRGQGRKWEKANRKRIKKWIRDREIERRTKDFWSKLTDRLSDAIDEVGDEIKRRLRNPFGW